MEPLTTGILASALYEVLKHGVTISATALKEQLSGWLQNARIYSYYAQQLQQQYKAVFTVAKFG